MIKLFDRLGSYNYMSFRDKKGDIWMLVGTCNGEIDYKQMNKTSISLEVLSCLDTFKSKKRGIYMEKKRKDVLEQSELGNITPVEESKIELKTDVKKKTGRAV